MNGEDTRFNSESGSEAGKKSKRGPSIKNAMKKNYSLNMWTVKSKISKIPPLNMRKIPYSKCLKNNVRRTQKMNENYVDFEVHLDAQTYKGKIDKFYSITFGDKREPISFDNLKDIQNILNWFLEGKDD
jgi:hypothetical protein